MGGTAGALRGRSAAIADVASAVSGSHQLEINELQDRRCADEGPSGRSRQRQKRQEGQGSDRAACCNHCGIQGLVRSGLDDRIPGRM